MGRIGSMLNTQHTLIDDRAALHLDSESHADDAQDPQPSFAETAAEALLVPNDRVENISIKPVHST